MKTPYVKAIFKKRILWIVFAILSVMSFGCKFVQMSSASEPDVAVGIRPYFDSGTEIKDIVALRYKLRVNKNKSPSLKILFGFKRFYTPGNGDTYLLETNLYSHWLKYQDTGCVGWPPVGKRVFGRSGLWVSMPDYHYQHSDVTKRGRIGMRPKNDLTKKMFPRQTIEIDGFPGLTKMETISQRNITKKNIEVTYTRGDTLTVTTPLSGWGHRYIQDHTGVVECTPNLPPGTYRIWVAEIRINSKVYMWEFALPDESARYFYPHEITSFVTEFFGDNSEFFQIYLWDFNIQRENSISWEALRRWEVYRANSGPTNVKPTYGVKRSTYKKQEVIEFSNEGTDTYDQLGNLFELGIK